MYHDIPDTPWKRKDSVPKRFPEQELWRQYNQNAEQWRQHDEVEEYSDAPETIESLRFKMQKLSEKVSILKADNNFLRRNNQELEDKLKMLQESAYKRILRPGGIIVERKEYGELGIQLRISADEFMYSHQALNKQEFVHHVVSMMTDKVIHKLDQLCEENQ